MEQLILKTDDYSVWKADKSCLQELSSFVVTENEKHHHASKTPKETEGDIRKVYQEEAAYAGNSRIFLAKDNEGKIIGSIRVFKWDKDVKLPIEEIFGINPSTAVPGKSDFWHVGRFAIDSFSGVSTVRLFKQMMALAIRPILEESSEGCMIAEIDSKLLKVMNALGIGTIQLGPSQDYLSSETVPIYSPRNGLLPFFEHFGYLCTA